MITTRELPDVLRRLGATDVEHRQDRKRSISSTTIRFVKDGRRGVAVGAEVAHRIDVFTDLVSLHLDDPAATSTRRTCGSGSQSAPVIVRPRSPYGRWRAAPGR